MKIVSFGDSFIFGSELKDNHADEKAWIDSQKIGCRDRGYTVTEPSWHPIEPAHDFAAELWLETYRAKLTER